MNAIPRRYPSFTKRLSSARTKMQREEESNGSR